MNKEEMRSNFEVWYLKECEDDYQMSFLGSEYQVDIEQACWEAWQAAIESQQSESKEIGAEQKEADKREEIIMTALRGLRSFIRPNRKDLEDLYDAGVLKLPNKDSNND